MMFRYQMRQLYLNKDLVDNINKWTQELINQVHNKFSISTGKTNKYNLTATKKKTNDKQSRQLLPKKVATL